jgi:anaerobic ribonucleoside-triphosphate reductase
MVKTETIIENINKKALKELMIDIQKEKYKYIIEMTKKLNMNKGAYYIDDNSIKHNVNDDSIKEINEKIKVFNSELSYLVYYYKKYD